MSTEQGRPSMKSSIKNVISGISHHKIIDVFLHYIVMIKCCSNSYFECIVVKFVCVKCESKYNDTIRSTICKLLAFLRRRGHDPTAHF